MNKLIMALALVLTPFFSLADPFDDIEYVDLEDKEVDSYYCKTSGQTKGSVEIGKEVDPVQACASVIQSFVSNVPDVYNCGNTSTKVVPKYGSLYVERHYGHGYGTCSRLIQDYSIQPSFKETLEYSECPPSHPQQTSINGEAKCYNPDDVPEEEEEEEEECGEGYHRAKHYNNAGVGQCVPVTCESEGSVKDIYASGSVYDNSSGTYCNGYCASSVSAGQNDEGYGGRISVRTVSTGSACGGHPDDSWFDSGNGDECQTTTASSGVSFLKCPVGDGGGDTPEQPDSKIDLGENKLAETDIPTLIPIVEVCTAGDPSCEIRNLKESIKAQETVKQELAVEAHNKAVEAQQTSTNSIIESIEGLRESNISAAEHNSKGGGENGNGATTGGGGDGGEGECSSTDGCSYTSELRQEPSEGLEGFWESEYEDGIEGMFQEKIDELKATKIFSFIEEFKPQISGGVAPMFNWCFNFGKYMNFGCLELKLDPRVYPALKVFILLTASFGCRRILFGG